MGKLTIDEMDNIRVLYHKKGRAKYISHLDITRLMQRAIKRSGIPVWYTQGYNPHIYLTFALPLPLGYESDCEYMDLRLCEKVNFEQVKNHLNASLPRDIRVISVELQQNKPSAIKSAIYDVTIESEELDGKTLNDCILNFLEQDEIEVAKQTKKGTKIINIKNDIELLSTDVCKRAITLKLKLTAGIEKNVNPSLITDEIIGKYNLQDVVIGVVRRKLYMQDGQEFK